jgi:transcriptional regulator with XRE-family HTH domain
MTAPRRSIPHAVRDVRRALGLRQTDFAARIVVSRETVSAWERGSWQPTHEQRALTVARLADVPPEILLPLVEAFGVATPPGVAAPRSGTGRPTRSPDEAAARVLGAIRSAADELDVPASGLRRTLAVALGHIVAAGASLEDAAAVLQAGDGRLRRG